MIYEYFKYLTDCINRERRDSIVRIVRGIKKKDLMVDFGCDDGRLTNYIAKQADINTVVGVDISSERLKLAKKRRIKAIRADLNKKLPIRAGIADLVVSIQTIEHIIEIDSFFSEAKRILKSRGYIIITTENLASWHNLFALLLGNQPYSGPYLSKKFSIGHHPLGSNPEDPQTPAYRRQMPPHINVMTTRALIQLLQKYGFTVEKVVGIGYYPFPPIIAQILSKIDPFHSAVCLIKARKS